MRNETSATTATPPTVPPTIAPTGVELLCPPSPLLLDAVLDSLPNVIVVLGIKDDGEVSEAVLLVEEEVVISVGAEVRAGGVARSVSIPP